MNTRENKPKRVVLIGCGLVGTSFLYSAIHQQVADEYFLIDLNKDLVKGNILDLEDSFSCVDKHINIYEGSYSDIDDADVLLITAGITHTKDQTRDDILNINKNIIRSIAKEFNKQDFKGVVIIASNPVDVTATVFQKETGYDKNKVISSSCALDSKRFTIEISKYLDIPSNEIKAYTIGEHGVTTVPVFSNIFVGGERLEFNVEEHKKFVEETKKYVVSKVQDIIRYKGSTFYGVGTVLASLAKAIIRDEKKTFSVGIMLQNQYGLSNVYASLPSVVGAKGIIKTLDLELSDEEIEDFKFSVEKIKKGL